MPIVSTRLSTYLAQPGDSSETVIVRHEPGARSALREWVASTATGEISEDLPFDLLVVTASKDDVHSLLARDDVLFADIDGYEETRVVQLRWLLALAARRNITLGYTLSAADR